jgi:RNA polymerase sigma-70 factor (ECF subfamily)
MPPFVPDRSRPPQDDPTDVAGRLVAGGLSVPRDFAEALAASATGASERIGRLLTRLCRGDRELAEELWSRALARACERGASFDTSRPLEPWLRRLVFRVWLDERARRRRAPEAHDCLDPPEPTDPHVQVDLRDEVGRLMAALEPTQRTILLRLHRDGESVAEIARALGMPENTVKSHARRARMRLRELHRGDEPR